MRCRDCDGCKKGWFESKPEEYVCIFVKEPFVIDNINKECTEYMDECYKENKDNNDNGMDDVAASLVNLYADYAHLNGNTNDEYAKAVAIAIRMLTD